MSGARIKMDPSKVKAIESWLVPKTIHDVRSFHGMVSFYRRFIKHSSTLVVAITECLKGGDFKWTKEADESFDLVKRKITTVPVLIILDFHEVFEVDCDASNVGIGVVINQEGKSIAFFSEKLNKAMTKSSM